MKVSYKLILANIFVFIFLIELLAFFLFKIDFFTNPIKPSYSLSKNDSSLEFWNEKESWGVWHKKNKTVLVKNDCLNVTYTSNNYGNRDNEDYYFNETSNRIVLIGDSFAEGYGLNIENSFAKKLELKAKKKVLNFGTSGDFGPVQGYILYKNLASKFLHNELIVFFLPANDFTDNSFKNSYSFFENRYRPYFKKNTLNDYSIIYPPDSNPSNNFPSMMVDNSSNLKKILVSFLYSSNIYREIKNTSLMKNQGYFFNDLQAIDGSIYFLNELLKLTNDSVKKTIIVIPTLYDLDNINKSKEDYKKLHWYKEINKIAKNNQASLIDIAETHSRDINPSRFFNKCDGHWSAEGSEDVVMNYIEVEITSHN